MAPKKEKQTAIHKGKKHSVEKVVDRRLVDRIAQYLVKWEDLDESQNQWEPIHNLMNCLDAVVAFEEKFMKIGTANGQKRAATPKPSVEPPAKTTRRSDRLKKENPTETPAPAAADGPETPAQNLDGPVSSPDCEVSEDGDEGQKDEGKCEEFAVDKILAKKIQDGRTFYRVKWLGYGNRDNSWEPPESFDDCPELIEEFEQKTTTGKGTPRSHQKEQRQKEEVRKALKEAGDIDPISKTPFPKPKRR